MSTTPPTISVDSFSEDHMHAHSFASSSSILYLEFQLEFRKQSDNKLVRPYQELTCRHRL